MTSLKENTYSSTGGTSFAQPFVAGVAAIMLQLDPDLDGRQIESILKVTAQPLVAFSEEAQGAGQIHPKRAVALTSYLRCSRLKHDKKRYKLADRLGIPREQIRAYAEMLAY